MNTPPTIFPNVAGKSQAKYCEKCKCPEKTAATISALLAMQWEKWPAPTMKVSIQMIATCPIVQWLAVTIHATRAISHPPITPLAKINVKCP